MDDFNFDNIPVDQQQQQQQQQQQDDPELGPPNDAAQFLPQKVDLTVDKVDWKALEAEDKRMVEELCQEKKWDVDRVWASGAFCAACECRPNPMNPRVGVAREVFAELDATAKDLYSKSKIEVTCRSVRDIWFAKQLKRMAPGEHASTSNVKFWSSRQVYEHLHSHDYTEYARLHQDCRSYDDLKRELEAAYKRVDPLTGLTTMDARLLTQFRAVIKEGRQFQQDKRKVFQRADWRFFSPSGAGGD